MGNSGDFENRKYDAMLLSQPMKSYTAAGLVALAMNVATQNREGGRSN